MTSLRRLFSGLLALAIGLQGSLALAQCLRLAPPAALRMEICTAAGMQSIALPAEDEGQGEIAPHLVVCLTCQSLAHGQVPEPAGMPAPRLQPGEPLVLAAWTWPVLGARAPPYAPTGPPIHA